MGGALAVTPARGAQPGPPWDICAGMKPACLEIVGETFRRSYAGSASRAVHIRWNAGRAWQAASQACTAGNSAISVRWPWA